MAKTIKKDVIHANGIDIGIYTTDYENEYISLTDIAKYRSIQPAITIHNWLRNRDVVEFLGLWETLHNPDFKVIEFDNFKKDAGTNAYVFSIKEWTERIGAIGLLTKSGRYGGGFYQREFDSKGINQDTNILYLCQRGRFIKYGFIWNDSQGVERT